MFRLRSRHVSGTVFFVFIWHRGSQLNRTESRNLDSFKHRILQIPILSFLLFSYTWSSNATLVPIRNAMRRGLKGEEEEESSTSGKISGKNTIIVVCVHAIKRIPILNCRSRCGQISCEPGTTPGPMWLCRTTSTETLLSTLSTPLAWVTMLVLTSWKK